MPAKNDYAEKLVGLLADKEIADALRSIIHTCLSALSWHFASHVNVVRAVTGKRVAVKEADYDGYRG